MNDGYSHNQTNHAAGTQHRNINYIYEAFLSKDYVYEVRSTVNVSILSRDMNQSLLTKAVSTLLQINVQQLICALIFQVENLTTEEFKIIYTHTTKSVPL